MAKATRVISKEHLAKMQAGAKKARAAKVAEGQKCDDCGRKVDRHEGDEPYPRSSQRPGVIYCWPGTGCWVTPRTRKALTRADL